MSAHLYQPYRRLADLMQAIDIQHVVFQVGGAGTHRQVAVVVDPRARGSCQEHAWL